MAKSIYRQAALERLASPEQIDRPHTLVDGKVWFALLTLFAVTAGAIVWAATLKGDVMVDGRGVVLQPAGLREIIADKSGRIEELNLAPGGVVGRDVIVARFRLSELQAEHAEALAARGDATRRLAELKRIYDERNASELAAETERLAAIADGKRAIRRSLELLEKKATAIRDLVSQRITSRDELINTEILRTETLERLAVLEREEGIIGLRRLERENAARISLLDEQLKLEEIDRRVTRLQERLARESVLRSPYDGRVVEVKVERGDVLAEGAALATIEPTGTATSGQKIAVLFVPADQGKRVRAGMDAEVVPGGYRRAEFGFVPAKVVSVSEVPATPAGMRQVLRNDALVGQLAAGGTLFEVRVALEQDAEKPSGLAWSSSNGPDAQIEPGNLLEAKIVVDRIPLINLVAPRLYSLMGLGDD
ncbi:MAG: NHLP bacteriocin system secretion protein [Rhodobiaceae bacterium]|nr:NHLP bacteriocin system secretion protein [Rhodobiaceae bacterium]MCC0013576.1 NHLP bacteriocin system secretion protein [Rhodobiaceae bacterium]MCC0018310.1 NHLP bacteriocin system secretion protein [Rhodobiaceae bacterium]MCC0060629.1 NHLP bacteriocin system secretion protein [Rhodobiaceae bacterium]